MMKYVYAVMMLFSWWACSNQIDNRQVSGLQARIDSLEAQLAKAYHPGLGEFMSSLQIHHAKLWFAGKNQNWELADFEIKEINEALADIPVYCADRPEIKKIGIMTPAMDSLIKSIEARNSGGFERNFQNLTQTCNECHQATEHGFNVIKVPDSPPFANQEFRLK